MTDAVHDQHWRLAARDHDRIVATGPAVSSPPVPNFFAEVMFIQKNRPRTTVAEPIGETLAELPFTGDQVVCFRPRPGRLERICINDAAGRQIDDGATRRWFHGFDGAGLWYRRRGTGHDADGTVVDALTEIDGDTIIIKRRAGQAPIKFPDPHIGARVFEVPNSQDRHDLVWRAMSRRHRSRSPWYRYSAAAGGTRCSRADPWRSQARRGN